MRRLRILQIFSRYLKFGGEEGFVGSFRNASLSFHGVTDYQGSSEELLGRSFSSKLMLPARAFHSSRVANELRHLQKKGSFDLWVIQNALPGLPHLYIKLLLISKFLSFTTSTTIGWAAPTVFS